MDSVHSEYTVSVDHRRAVVDHVHMDSRMMDTHFHNQPVEKINIRYWSVALEQIVTPIGYGSGIDG